MHGLSMTDHRQPEYRYHERAHWCHEGWRWLTRGQGAMNVGHHETTSVSGSAGRRLAPRYWHKPPTGSVETRAFANHNARI